jgi:hypothetical protein
LKPDTVTLDMMDCTVHCTTLHSHTHSLSAQTAMAESATAVTHLSNAIECRAKKRNKQVAI